MHSEGPDDVHRDHGPRGENRRPDPQQAQTLDAAIRGGQLRTESSTDPDELATYADLRRFMGRGEAACLSMAERCGWLVAVDERGPFLRLA